MRDRNAFTRRPSWAWENDGRPVGKQKQGCRIVTAVYLSPFQYVAQVGVSGLFRR